MSHYKRHYLAAASRGFYRVIAVEGSGHGLILAVKHDARLDDRFKAVCLETGDTLTVNGWLYALEDGADQQAEVVADIGFDWRELRATPQGWAFADTSVEGVSA